MGTGTKAAASLESSEKKKGNSQRDLYWAGALLCHHRRNSLFWELGSPRLAVRGRNPGRAFVSGQSHPLPQVALAGDGIASESGHEAGK